MKDVVGVWSGREFTRAEMRIIESLIKNNPKATRAELSRMVCSDLNWRDDSGRLKDMRCRVVMLRMHEKGILLLPPPRHRKNPSRHKIVSTSETDPRSLITQSVDQLDSITFSLVTAENKKLSKIWNEYIHRYHYLGYEPCIGANLRYMLWSGDEPICLLSIGAAAWQTAPRDSYVSWDQEQRTRNLKYIVNNTRFLILPWVKSPNLASWVLSRIAKRLPMDWQARYGYSPYLIETFVDSSKYTGHCYKASNWTLLGRTVGRGKYANKKVTSEKDIWIYPLQRKWKANLLKD